MSLAAAVLFAVTDEIHQSFVPGREATVRDVVIDAFGSGAAIALRSALRPTPASPAGENQPEPAPGG